MRHLAILASLCAAAAIAAGCGGTGFRTSFRSSFMKSCTEQPRATTALCSCVEATLEREHTDDQLMKMTLGGAATNEELDEDARACAANGANHTTTGAPRSVGAQPVMNPARIAAYVTPYYNSDGPSIHVGPFSSGLASHDERRVLATTERMKRRWPQLSFPELYVGAIRLYDLGYRNEAVYWFYTAQYRGRQVGILLDPAKIGSVRDPGFELQAAADAFMQTVGTWINGYAFGHTESLIAVIRRVQKEGRQIGDLQAIYPDAAFIVRSRWTAANSRLAGGMDSLVAYLKQHENEIKRQRAANGTEAKFSHLTSK